MTRSTAIAGLLLWVWPAAVYAQTDARTGIAASLEQLQVLVSPGMTVTLTDAAGSQVSGRIAVSLYGAMGTGFGVGIDALIRREQSIYRRPGLNVSLRF
jgi:hypothetical protein